MIKCLECGKEAARLQWSHFRYNCTGRFRNGREYINAYPGAKTVSADLTAKTAVTLENMILKYGEDEGHVRWQLYKERQAYSNSYEYKKEKHGWTREQFDEYNSSRAQTLEKMIARYGEEDGSKKWLDYCERQAYTNTEQYFIEKHGRQKGIEKYLQINKEKAVSNPIILSKKMGITIEEATALIISRHRNQYTSNLEKEFIVLIEQEIGPLDHTTLKSPYGKWSSLLDTYVVYDIKHKNCIIEFNGDYWHANPKIYADTAVIRGKTAVDIRNRDKLKLQTVTEIGFRTLIVWESEFKQDKSQTIKKVLEWMLNEQK